MSLARAQSGASPQPLRIGFSRIGPHPIPNRLLVDELRAALPNAEVCVLDLEALARSDRRAMLTNAAFVAAEHGWKLATRRVRPWQAFFGTTFMFRWMSRRASEWAQAQGFDWTIQIQSLFDARAPGIPHFVFTDHTHLVNLGYPHFDPRALRSPRWIALERESYHAATLVFSRSAHVTASLVDQYGLDPAHVVCVGGGSNVRVPEQTVAHRDAGQNILFVGVDWVRKGGPDLVAAFQRVRRRHPRATLTIVGCKPSLDLPGVRVLGRRPIEEVHEHYEQADVFCLPTRREPFGVAFVEALHFGLPIVATRVGAVPDLIDHGVHGLLSEIDDVDSLANHLGQLLRDADLRRRMGDAGQARARDRYTWGAVARRMIDTVQKTTSTPRSDIAWEREPARS